MGTFHDNLGELHGITVVVDTKGSVVFVGRCHEWTEKGILLHDADRHDEGEKGLPKTDFLAKAAQFGAWPRFPSLFVAGEEIASVKRLGELSV